MLDCSCFVTLIHCCRFFPSTLVGICTNDLEPQDPRSTNHNVTSYKRRDFNLGTQPTHIDVSCDNELLAITLFAGDCAVLHVYSVPSVGSVVSKLDISQSVYCNMIVSLFI